MRRRTKSRENKLKWKALSDELRKDCPTCEYCNAKPATQVHHIIGKFYNKSQFRFDVANLICLCSNCHYNHFHKNPVATMNWFQKAREEDWIYLLEQLKPKMRYY